VDHGFEIAHLSRESCHIAVSQNIYVGMPTDIQQLRRQNSYCAVIGGKGLVQLGHLAADAGVLLDQMNLDAHLAKVQGSLHSGYPTADYEDLF